jgi:hypothetical protein
VLAALVLPFQVALTGTLPGWLAWLGPDLSKASPALVAVAAFVAAGVVLWLLAALVAVVRLRAARR